MQKIFIYFILISSTLFADDILALLQKVENNSALHMSHKQQTFLCQAYGVETIDALISRTDVNSTCKTFLNEFRQSHPKEKFYAAKKLHIKQQYSVSGVDGKCLLNLSSSHSYSEALLEVGYARIHPNLDFKDELLAYRFEKAVKRAKVKKEGFWSDENIINCFLTPKKK